MWPTQPPERPPWPVAPRPFPEEAMGSWLGRVAARYRMSVLQLCEDYGLSLAKGASNGGWLLQGPINAQELARLAWLARLEVQRLQEIQTPNAWVVERRGFAYCAPCLFLNPVDVTAPRWKREWLDPAATWCDEHGAQLALVAPGKLRRCSNFTQTVKAIGRLERQRQLNLPSYWR